MLRITIHDKPGALTFQLEGKLAGPWVEEAKDCWQRTLATLPTEENGRRPVVRFDLTGVIMIDVQGRDFLAAAHAQGAEMIASGCMMRAIVAQLTNTPLPGCGCPETDNKEPYRGTP
jgi:hypothetical protein